MMNYGYIIYKEFNTQLNKKVFDYNTYLDHYYLALYKDNRIYKKWLKHVVFFSIVALLIYYIYTNK